MRHAGQDLSGPLPLQKRRRRRNSPRGFREVIDHEHVAAANFTDHRQRLRFGRALASFGDNGQARPQNLRIGVRHFQPANIRADDHQIAQLLGFQVLIHHGRGVEMIHRDVEKPLNLLRVQIHGQDSVRPGRNQEIGDQFRRDRHPRLVFAILPSVPVKGQHRRYPRRARAPHRVHHDEHLHQVMVGRRRRRLNDENVLPPDVLLDLHESFTVGKRLDRAFAQVHTDVGGDVRRQRLIGSAGKKFHKQYLNYQKIKPPSGGCPVRQNCNNCAAPCKHYNN